MKTRKTEHPRRRVTNRGKQVISRIPLHEQVADAVRSMIITGTLAPGEKIRISELAEELDVSMTPMREALKILAKESLVELMANRGARVSEISAEGTRSLFEVISRLEALAAELAAERITEDELARLDDLHARMLESHAANDLPGYFDCNLKIHNLVVDAAKNPDLTRVRTLLGFHVERARFLSVATSAHREVSMEDHSELMQALKARNAAAARDIWQVHLQRAGDEACRLVARWQEEVSASATG
ncbi:GntR family transcriptional regulator [Puniceibacterium confluentis]|uniref:GntR family transcriptional regulator n=1 Tax=Puniceibacterium confluentis TaxID=1958944 RepID=UPI0016468A55|nr:GntR family transcriptional regulator [Puniceibacterium confluentis]